MANEETILDGLAWTQIKEPARVAKISAGLVRTTTSYSRTITKTSIQEAVKATMPPHGRGKAICEAVGIEVQRQLPIWSKRQQDQRDFDHYLADKASHATRLNDTYAARFGRPTRNPVKGFPGGYNEFEARQAWDKKEADRDKGDTCIGLLIYEDVHTVALLTSADRLPGNNYIAVRSRLGGEPVYTPLREQCGHFVDAAISLGGPQVRSALSQGYPVLTDWTGRRSIITYPDGKKVELPWRTVKFSPGNNGYGDYHHRADVMVLGTEELPVPKPYARESDD
jgi:hypothetical protein